jgi:hypothetical protein
MVRGSAVATAALLLLAAAPVPQHDVALPAGAQTAIVRRYVDALAAHRYVDAYALLDDAAQAYYRNPADFASGFTADAATIVSYAFTGSRGDAHFRLYFAREQLRLHDPVHDTTGTTTVTIPYGVSGSGDAARIKDLGRPWRALAVFEQKTGSGLRVTVHKLSLYEHAAALVVTFANTGDGFVTVLPYGRSLLRDDGGGVYRPIVNKTWLQTDRQLFLGVHLAANAEISGVLTFATPVLDDRARHFTLTVAPNVRDRGATPFAVDVAGIGPP